MIDLTKWKGILAATLILLLGDHYVRAQSHKYMDINNIKACVNDNGKLFTAPMDSGFGSRFELEGSKKAHGIFQSSLWISAKSKSGTLLVAADKYSGRDYFAGTVNKHITNNQRSIIKLNKSEIEFHKQNYNLSGYAMIDAIKDWPAVANRSFGEFDDLAPYIDVNSNGCYDPANGDYPFIKGDQAIYFIINDSARNHTSSNGRKIGLEIHVMVYGWNKSANHAVNSTIFVDYTIKNRSPYDLESVIVGQFTDFDLGCPLDDYIGADSSSNLVYVYNGDFNDNDCSGYDGFGKTPPVVGMGYMTDTLNSFMYFNNDVSVTGDPSIASEYHNYLKSMWKDSTHLVYGKNGHLNSGAGPQRSNFVYTGDPVARKGWTEVSAGNLPADRRGVMSMPAFNLNQGEEKQFTVAFGYGYDTANSTNYLKNINTLRDNFAASKAFLKGQNFETSTVGTASCLNSLVSNPDDLGYEITVYPNPATNTFGVLSSRVLSSLELVDLRGQLITSYEVVANESSTYPLPAHIKSGTYLIRWTTDSDAGVKKLMVN